jgi:hypothetical protein
MATLLAACGGQGDDGMGGQAAAAPQLLAMQPSVIEATTVTMHGGGASVISNPEENPALASDAEREQMELDQIEYEKSFSIEMNRQHGEWVARMKAAEEALRNGSTCADPTMLECAKGG